MPGCWLCPTGIGVILLIDGRLVCAVCWLELEKRAAKAKDVAKK